MKKTLFDHWRFSARRDYPIPREVDLSQFTARELELIRKYGNWMEALEYRTLVPITQAQLHFLRVCGDEEEPVAEFAMAWKKLKRAVREKREAARWNWLRNPQQSSPRIWTACPTCGGGGRGASGLCSRCAGTGWINDPVEPSRKQVPQPIRAVRAASR